MYVFAFMDVELLVTSAAVGGLGGAAGYRYG
jgi:hypothetical protein